MANNVADEMRWRNMSIVTINVMLQILDIYICIGIDVG